MNFFRGLAASVGLFCAAPTVLVAGPHIFLPICEIHRGSLSTHLTAFHRVDIFVDPLKPVEGSEAFRIVFNREVSPEHEEIKAKIISKQISFGRGFTQPQLAEDVVALHADFELEVSYTKDGVLRTEIHHIEIRKLIDLVDAHKSTDSVVWKAGGRELGNLAVNFFDGSIRILQPMGLQEFNLKKWVEALDLAKPVIRFEMRRDFVIDTFDPDSDDRFLGTGLQHVDFMDHWLRLSRKAKQSRLVEADPESGDEVLTWPQSRFEQDNELVGALVEGEEHSGPEREHGFVSMDEAAKFMEQVSDFSPRFLQLKILPHPHGVDLNRDRDLVLEIERRTTDLIEIRLYGHQLRENGPIYIRRDAFRLAELVFQSSSISVLHVLDTHDDLSTLEDIPQPKEALRPLLSRAFLAQQILQHRGRQLRGGADFQILRAEISRAAACARMLGVMSEAVRLSKFKDFQ